MKTQENRTIPFEKIAAVIAKFGKLDIIRRIRRFNGSFKLDFTDEYLNSLSVEKLRHILMAAMTTRISHEYLTHSYSNTISA